MTLYWPARLSLLLYLILLTLIVVNVTLVLEFPMWLAIIPTALALGVLAVSWFLFGTRHALFTCLLGVSIIALVSVALVLAVPAWQVIFTGASGSWAGRMVPLFVAVLALHACNLWISTMGTGEHQNSLERLAQLFYGPSILSSLITALILCAGTILGLELLARSAPNMHAITQRFLERGMIPPLTMLLFFWAMLLLLGKSWNGWYLRRVLTGWRTTVHARTLYSDANPEMSQIGVSPFTLSLDALVAKPADLNMSLQLLWRRHEESWLLPRYISWAVPILGFIGTVLGISLAADGIRRIIASDAGLANLSSDLDTAIAPLGIAFDTTLIALSLSVVLMLVLALVQRSEERLLTNLEQRLQETLP